MLLEHRNLFLICILIYLNSEYFKIATANKIFRFGFDLEVNANYFKTSFKVGDGEENEVNSIETTTVAKDSYYTESPHTSASPILKGIWSKQAQLRATANDKLQATRVAVTQFKNEILVVVGRSDFIAAKVKLMTRYLNKVNAVSATKTVTDDGGDGDSIADSGHNDEAANRFLVLQDYVHLVDDLRAPPTSAEGGERSLDYMVMKLGLKKHKLIELQTQILVDVLQAMETWQTYVKEQLVNVVTV